MKSLANERAWAANGIVFSIGFFGLAAQVLLFREFFGVFEGNELSVGLFFCSWLVWVAIGAFLARWRLQGAGILRDYFEFLPLIYLPAYALQEWLIGNSRAFADIKPYELFPLVKMIPLAFAANAPVSLCSGALFTLACEWISATQRTPVSRVYIVETAGSFAGGVVVTLLLAKEMPVENLPLIAALVPAAAFFLYRLRPGSLVVACVPPALILAALLAGFGEAMERANNLRRWSRLMPAECFRGAFSTPQAKYLYGEYRGQFNVVAWESVQDSIPNTEHASEVIALHLAQNPDARKFLVIGPGSFSICKRLHDLPQAEAITWLDTDPDCPGRLLAALPPAFRGGLRRLGIPSTDIRRHLALSREKYDVVIMNMPGVTTLALNRYFTREFLSLVRENMAESGTLGLRVASGENYMGDELVNVGASAFNTLSSVFKNVTVKPGEESWLLASDGDRLSSSPAVLRDRFRAIEGAEKLYPPEGLLSLYLPERIGYQLESYRNSIRKIPEKLLLNTDSHPKALLHSLLFAARQAGATFALASTIKSLAMSGAILAPLAVCLYGLLRRVYAIKSGARGARPADAPATRSFDDHFLVFSTGGVSMGINIVLMFMYQSIYGSLFLHVGLISAVFMLGLCLGSLASQGILSRAPATSWLVMPIGILLYAPLAAAVAFSPADLSQSAFIGLFLLAGALGGVFVPVAASRLNAAGVPHRVTGAMIEWNDHLGGACGGLLTALVLLPIFGGAYAACALAFFAMVNLEPLARRSRPIDAGAGRFKRVSRVAGYTMFGVAVFLMAAALIFRRGERGEIARFFNASVEAMRGDLQSAGQTAALKSGGNLEYFVLRAGETNRAWVYSAEKLAPGINGYGGPITLSVRSSPEGVLEDFRIIESNETPAYLDSLASWFRKLIGKQLRGRDALKGVDAVTGATMTSAAFIKTLRTSGQSFARQALGLSVEEPEEEVRVSRRTWRVAVFALFAAAALAMRVWPSRAMRRVFLLLVASVLGVAMNVQYSLAHVFSLIGLKIPPPAWSEAFPLVVATPIFALLFGNVYCGYLCPFGALQELVGELRPGALATDPEKEVWRYGRLAKFVMLFLMVVWFATTLGHALASHDPLATFFSPARTAFVVSIAWACLALSFFFGRFWCRNLCPAGAFLSLLNGAHLLKRFIPAIASSRCEFGVAANNELDCICCDRCRMPPRRATGESRLGEARNIVFIVAVIATLVVFAQKGLEAWRDERAGFSAGRMGMATGGKPRDVDMRRIKFLIESGALSDREAMYYKAIGDKK